MKVRVFDDMRDSVYRIVIFTEAWSQGDIELMRQHGEPEIDVGGEIQYLYGDNKTEDSADGDAVRTKVLGSEMVRLIHGFPYARGFDSRDYESDEEAIAVGNAWKECVIEKLRDAVANLRSSQKVLPNEEVFDNI